MYLTENRRREFRACAPASGTHMEAPMCLIENRGKEFRVCQEALQLLSKIHQPVVVVAIVGLYRTGKSYLMNKLAGKTSGFLLGSTVQANTKGIWMWCIPHPKQPGQTLVLLDTEGLGDMEKGDPKNDTWIFVLAVLLSSTLVYNTKGTIDQNAMNELHVALELAEHIKTRDPGLKNAAKYADFFPNFIWTLRDFALELELNGNPITADDYLENALKLKKSTNDGGNDSNIKLFNLPRECIRELFPVRKCFVFERPTSRKNLPRLEKMEERELDADFVKQAAEFCSHIYCTSRTKTIPGGSPATGHLLAKLAETYVDTLRSGKVPCIENAVLALAEIENSAAVADATARYVELMERRLKLPTETLEELLGIHARCKREALREFRARAFKDNTCQFQAQLMKTLHEEKKKYCQKNERESLKYSSSLLKSLAWDLNKHIKKGTYYRPGGHNSFMDDLEEVKERYHQKPCKGVMANAALEQFLKDMDGIAETIHREDKILAEQQKRLEEAKAQAEALEREAERLRRLEQQARQTILDNRRRFEAQQRSLMAVWEEDRRCLMAEQERLQEQFQRQMERMLPPVRAVLRIEDEDPGVCVIL